MYQSCLPFLATPICVSKGSCRWNSIPGKYQEIQYTRLDKWPVYFMCLPGIYLEINGSGLPYMEPEGLSQNISPGNTWKCTVHLSNQVFPQDTRSANIPASNAHIRVECLHTHHFQNKIYVHIWTYGCTRGRKTNAWDARSRGLSTKYLRPSRPVRTYQVRWLPSMIAVIFHHAQLKLTTKVGSDTWRS